MKYFIDTKFIEGFKKPFFCKKRHFIDLISIGIVREDGLEFEAISSEYSFNDANKWVRENVIMPLYHKTVSPGFRGSFTPMDFQRTYGDTLSDIRACILDFIDEDPNPVFYGYFCDYDWVLFCSLFGRMIDLPPRFPMYCRDLKQMMDEKAEGMKLYYFKDIVKKESDMDRPADLIEKLNYIKFHPDYPNLFAEHSAVADAHWNLRLYKFLQNLHI